MWYPYVSLVPDLLCKFGLSVSGLRKIHFNAYTPWQISTKYQFPNKLGFLFSTLIILDWYLYVSLVPDLLCKFGLSVSGLRKIRFNAYTPRQISTKNQFPNKLGFLFSTLIILDWYLYVSLLTDSLCKFGLSVSGLRKIRFNAYTPRQISTKNQFPNKLGFLFSMLIILDWYLYVSLLTDSLCKFGLSVSGLRKIRFNTYTPLRISTKKSITKETRISIVHSDNFRSE